MSKCNQHKDHTHQHGKKCGHPQIKHNDHIDYLHDGHLHHVHEDHVDEHHLEVSSQNPEVCTPDIHCAHQHGPECGCPSIPHGDHIDYIVNGRLHHPHGDHCDDHGPVEVLSN